MQNEIERLREERNIARRALSKYLQKQRRLDNDLKMLDRLEVLLDKDYAEMTMAELVETRNYVQRAYEILPQVEPYLILMQIQAIFDAIQKIKERQQMHEREKRLEQKQLQREWEEHNQIDEHLCIVCQKRPRHFEDYCKRCVPENLRPKGKIK